MRKLLLVLIMFLFVGCSDTPTLYNNGDYKGEPIKLAEGVYFKKVYIQGLYVLLQCDKEGNILSTQNVAVRYSSGKTDTHTGTISAINIENNSTTYNFKCDDINDCYSQIMTVKKVLNK